MKNPFSDPIARLSAGRFGMGLLLLSLGVLFIASVAAIIIIRIQLTLRDQWPVVPRLPILLAFSTLVLIASGGTMHAAVRVARLAPARERAPVFARWMNATIVLGVAFVLLQGASWVAWSKMIAPFWDQSNEWRLALTAFFVLSGLHALHVLGGLLALALTKRHAAAGWYADEQGDRVIYCAMYWHFLDVVWLALYAILLVAT